MANPFCRRHHHRHHCNHRHRPGRQCYHNHHRRCCRRHPGRRLILIIELKLKQCSVNSWYLLGGFPLRIRESPNRKLKEAITSS